ncbi:MAG TPA: glycosyltransferase, partial [Candidatus Acidoferrum sp.]
YLGDEKLLSLVYSAADLFVLPALQDNLPNSALEALACGVPVVAFNAGGIPEIVRDGIEGRLVPRGDVAGLRLAICDMLNRSDTLRQMSANARHRATQEFALELQARRYLQLYERIIRVGSSRAASR